MLVRLSHASTFSKKVGGGNAVRAEFPSGATRSLMGVGSAFADDMRGGAFYPGRHFRTPCAMAGNRVESTP